MNEWDDEARLTPDLVLHAYRSGIFPMAEHRDDPSVFWVDPRKRGILPLDGFHMSRSLVKRLRSLPHDVTINTDFIGVLEACADRDETWINTEIKRLFVELHYLGKAHSLEVWSRGQLIGGVYGLALGAAFCGESMFSRAVDGSKIALAYLVDRLRQGGFTLFDTQFITPHLSSLGAIEIPRGAYHRALQAALDMDADFAGPPLIDAQELLQRRTQTS
ncbi:leucyl/phenylalanyl-tRNA--protein transferase [Primorskyibacter sp. S187A]|uniref:leucyl/phenylalanyl-tRNA--protein transferase n=1 Tax=Primorskyibacter sp. S187A TaxID=3415130 RepID=UPI003C7C3B65